LHTSYKRTRNQYSTQKYLHTVYNHYHSIMQTRRHIKKMKHKSKDTRKKKRIRARGRKLLKQISNSASESIRTME